MSHKLCHGACRVLLFSALCLLVAVAFAAGQASQQAAGKNTQSASAPKATTPSSEASKYVGAETCKTCHEEIYNAWEKTPHWKTTLNKEGGPSKQGCEGCHGPGADHVAGGGDKTKIFTFKTATAEEVTERCLGCHEKDAEHATSKSSPHSLNKVSCIDCHSPHHPAVKRFLLVKSQPQLCYGCHLNVKPQFKMPFHHRVDEGLLSCSDCHNPHGGTLPNQLRASQMQDAVCFTCHADKQGPFVFEHQPVKTEGCATCHTPHGSPNPRLLKVSQMNILCLQCHTASISGGAPGTPSFHDQSSSIQACTLCHTQIHGSNFSNRFFK